MHKSQRQYRYLSDIIYNTPQHVLCFRAFHHRRRTGSTSGGNVGAMDREGKGPRAYFLKTTIMNYSFPAGSRAIRMVAIGRSKESGVSRSGNAP